MEFLGNVIFGNFWGKVYFKKLMEVALIQK